MQSKRTFALSILYRTFISLFLVSCATQRTTPNNEAAFIPQDKPIVQQGPVAPEKTQVSEMKKEDAAKPAAKKARRSKASTPAMPPVTPPLADTRPENSLTEIPPAAAPAPAQVEEVVAQEASAEMGGFFVQHLPWMVGLGAGLGAVYFIVAWRRRRQQ